MSERHATLFVTQSSGPFEADAAAFETGLITPLAWPRVAVRHTARIEASNRHAFGSTAASPEQAS